MLAIMVGTLLNVAGILLGGVLGLARRTVFSPQTEAYFKIILAVCTVWCGVQLLWQAVGGSVCQVFKQLLLVMLALLVGNVIGRLLRLQKLSNRVGSAARERIVDTTSGAPKRPDAGFKTCTALFCAAPLGVIGAVVEGFAYGSPALSGSASVWPLAIKGAMDGLATIGFAAIFGWGVLLSVIPVLALQGTIWLLCAHWLQPVLAAHGLVNALEAAGGLLVFCVALVMLGLKRVPLADYLPSLVVAPLLAWWWHW